MYYNIIIFRGFITCGVLAASQKIENHSKQKKWLANLFTSKDPDPLEKSIKTLYNLHC